MNFLKCFINIISATPFLGFGISFITVFLNKITLPIAKHGKLAETFLVVNYGILKCNLLIPGGTSNLILLSLSNSGGLVLGVSTPIFY